MHVHLATPRQHRNRGQTLKSVGKGRDSGTVVSPQVPCVASSGPWWFPATDLQGHTFMDDPCSLALIDNSSWPPDLCIQYLILHLNILKITQTPSKTNAKIVLFIRICSHAFASVSKWKQDTTSSLAAKMEIWGASLTPSWLSSHQTFYIITS